MFNFPYYWKLNQFLTLVYYEMFNGKVKKLDAAIVFGMQYTLKRIIIGARYNLGLVDGNNFPTGYGSATKGWRSNVIQASLGYSF